MLAGAIETLRGSLANTTLGIVSPKDDPCNAVPPPSSPSSSSLYGATQTIRTLLERKATAIAAKVKQRLTEEQRLIIVAILSNSSPSLGRSGSSRTLEPLEPPPSDGGASGTCTSNEDMMMEEDDNNNNNEHSEENDNEADDAWGTSTAIYGCRNPSSSSLTSSVCKSKRRKKNSVSRLNADLKALLEPFLSETVGPCLAAIEGRIEDTYAAYQNQLEQQQQQQQLQHAQQHRRTDGRSTSDDDGFQKKGSKTMLLLEEVHESVRVAVQLYAVAVAAIRKAIEGPLIAAMTDAPTTLTTMANTSLLTAASSTATITASPMEADRLAQRALRRFRSACAGLLWISNDDDDNNTSKQKGHRPSDDDDDPPTNHTGHADEKKEPGGGGGNTISNSKGDDDKKDGSLVQVVLMDGIARRGVWGLLTRYLISTTHESITTTAANTEAEVAATATTTMTSLAMRQRYATEAFVMPLLAAAVAETTDPLLLKKQTATTTAADDGDERKYGKSSGGGGGGNVEEERNADDGHLNISMAQWIRYRFVPFWTLIPHNDQMNRDGNMLAIASKNKKKASKEEEEALDHEMEQSDTLLSSSPVSSVWRAIDHRLLSLALHRRWPFVAAAGEAAANLGDAFETLHTLVHPRQQEEEGEVEHEEGKGKGKGGKDSNDNHSEQHQLQRLLSEVRWNLRRPLQEMVHVARLRVAQHVYTLLLSARPEQKTRDHEEDEENGAGAAVDNVRRGAAGALVNAAWQLLCFSGTSCSRRNGAAGGSRLVALFTGQQGEEEEDEEKEVGNNTTKTTHIKFADDLVNVLRSVTIGRSSSSSNSLGPLFTEVLEGLQRIQGEKEEQKVDKRLQKDNDDELLPVLFIFDCIVALTTPLLLNHQQHDEQNEEYNEDEDDRGGNSSSKVPLWRARFRRTVTILRQHLHTCKATQPTISTPQQQDEQAAAALCRVWASLWHGYHRRYQQQQQQQQQKIRSVIPACNGKDQKKNEDEEKKNGSCSRTRFLSAMSRALNELMNAAATIPASV